MCVRMAVRMNDRENDAGIGLQRERERERESKLTASLIEHD